MYRLDENYWLTMVLSARYMVGGLVCAGGDLGIEVFIYSRPAHGRI